MLKANRWTAIKGASKASLLSEINQIGNVPGNHWALRRGIAILHRILASMKRPNFALNIMYVSGLLGWVEVLAQSEDTLAFRTWHDEARFGDRDVETLRINEICASNNTVWQTEPVQYPDWIELHNYGDEDINLMGRWLSDNPDDPFKHQIDQNLWIAAGGYLLLYADNQPSLGPAHLNFSLSSSGEDVLLSTADFVEIDAVSFGAIPTDMSWGYVAVNDVWALFPDPTPEAENIGQNFTDILQPPVFSESNLFFDSPFSLSMSQSQGAQIRFTVNYDDPTETSDVYTTPITVMMNVCVRARAYADGYYPSPVATQCFASAADYTLDIVTVTAPSGSFWGAGGIYSNPFSGLEKRVHVAQFSHEGEPKYAMDMGARIHAPDGRQQKSLRFHARSEYGNTSLDYPLFPTKSIGSFKRFVLRNAGNDGLEASVSRTGMRDPLISWLYSSLNPDYGQSAYEPVHLFLNGEYWGIYNMRERQDEHFIKSNYGYEGDEIDLLERTASVPSTFDALAGTWEDYDQMHQTAIDLDLSQDENYAIIADWINIENYVDYQLTEILICNQDWLSNNMKFWRPQDNSRKWEWIIWDTDWGFGTFYPSYPHGLPNWNALNFSLSNWGGWTADVETYLLQNLVESPIFLEYFCTRAADLRNSYFLPERIVSKLHEYRDRLLPDIPMQFERWGSSMMTWNSRVDYVESFVNDRPVHFLQHFTDRFDLGEIYPIHLEIDPPGAGYIEVNTIQTDNDVWEGYYFEGIPVRLKAMAYPGFTFSHWSNETFAAEQFVQVTPDVNLTAFFEEIVVSGLPIINEINYYPSAGLDAGEWIEIRNNGPGTVNLSGWTLEDDLSAYAIPTGTNVGINEFLVVCADTLLFKTVYPDVSPYIGDFNFALGNSGETLYLRNPEGQLIDAVTYSDSSPWPSAADGNGATLELISPLLDNAVATNWFCRPEAGGTPGAENVPYIAIEEPDSFYSMVFYPNPIAGHLDQASLYLSTKQAATFAISAFDLTGKNCGTLEMAVSEPGIQKLSASSIFNQGMKPVGGLYLLEVRSGDERKTMKVTLID